VKGSSLQTTRLQKKDPRGSSIDYGFNWIPLVIVLFIHKNVVFGTPIHKEESNINTAETVSPIGIEHVKKNQRTHNSVLTIETLLCANLLSRFPLWIHIYTFLTPMCRLHLACDTDVSLVRGNIHLYKLKINADNISGRRGWAMLGISLLMVLEIQKIRFKLFEFWDRPAS
jgi:hypothetical protein